MARTLGRLAGVPVALPAYPPRHLHVDGTPVSEAPPDTDDLAPKRPLVRPASSLSGEWQTGFGDLLDPSRSTATPIGRRRKRAAAIVGAVFVFAVGFGALPKLLSGGGEAPAAGAGAGGPGATVAPGTTITRCTGTVCTTVVAGPSGTAGPNGGQPGGQPGVNGDGVGDPGAGEGAGQGQGNGVQGLPGGNGGGGGTTTPPPDTDPTTNPPQTTPPATPTPTPTSTECPPPGDDENGRPRSRPPHCT